MRPSYPNSKILGVFIDNHDNRRYLYEEGRTRKSLENASIFTIFFEGIPVLYYGDEQYFEGGDDPNNREPLWGHYNETTLYTEFSKANAIRKNKTIWETELEDFECDEDFCSFTRGDILVAVTRGEPCVRTVKNHKFNIGDKICNIFNEEECYTLDKIEIDLNMDGDPKVFVKEEDLIYLHN